MPKGLTKTSDKRMQNLCNGRQTYKDLETYKKEAKSQTQRNFFLMQRVSSK